MGEHYEQIGGKLRSAREAAGLDLDDVVFKTQIPRSVVEALEAENFSVFTSPVYAKSFLRQYSDFLNVDAGPWLNALEPGSFMPGGHLRALVEGPDPQAEADVPAPDHRGGLLSVLGLLTLSAALVVGAIKGYEFLEYRFGSEGLRPPAVEADAIPPVVAEPQVETPADKAPEIQAVPASETMTTESSDGPPMLEPMPQPSNESEDEELPQAPLKAIPVE